MPPAGQDPYFTSSPSVSLTSSSLTSLLPKPAIREVSQPFALECKLQPFLRIFYVLGRTLCTVLRSKNIIQIGPSSREGYWKAHKTPTSGQVALELGVWMSLFLGFFWLLKTSFPDRGHRLMLLVRTESHPTWLLWLQL